MKARGFRITKGRTPPRQVKRAGMDVIEAIYEFETAVGRGQGVLRLPAARPERAWVISTSLRELKGHEEPVNGRRRAGGVGSRGRVRTARRGSSRIGRRCGR